MRLRDYLFDRRRGIGVFLGGLVLFCLGLWLDPEHRIAMATVAYMASLVLLIAAGFTWWQYLDHKRWLTQLADRVKAGDAALDWPLPASQNREQTLYATAYNQLVTAHRQSATSFVATSQDQREFIDTWVHEIKVPLAAATLLAERLEDTADPQQLDDLTLALDQIGGYVDQVLYYSRLDSFSKDYLLQPTALTTVVNDTVVGLRNLFIAKRLQFHLTGADHTVVTDAKWLRFILSQLLSNAVKYTASGGAITVTIAETGTETQLSVTDTGIGIPAGDLHRVFDKGFTGENGRNANHQATGLGLYLAKQLAAKLGHDLTIASTVEQGTTVTIHFPQLTYFGHDILEATHD